MHQVHVDREPQAEMRLAQARHRCIAHLTVRALDPIRTLRQPQCSAQFGHRFSAHDFLSFFGVGV
jgi:hypothetical protein